MAMLARIDRHTFAPGRRVIAISDIHAHLQQLRRLLDKVGFTRQDILVIVGDILHRGKENLSALRYLMRLSETHTVYPVIGNVDEWILSCALTFDSAQLFREAQQHLSWYGSSLFCEMAAELGLEITPELDIEAFRRGARERFAPELAFMHALPTVIQTPSLTFVHGGIPAGPIDALRGALARQLTKWDAYMDEGIVNDRWTIVGHWPVCLYGGGPMRFSPVASARQRTVSIDGGCGIKDEGQLNALIIEDGAFHWQSYDELPAAVALDAQAASSSYHAITFMNGEIDVLSREGGCTLVRHKPCGYRMWAPNEQIYDSGGTPRCNDITDYRLPVAPGDLLRILWETDRGVVCKKNGVEGWYAGRLSPVRSEEAEAKERAAGPWPLELYE